MSWIVYESTQEIDMKSNSVICLLLLTTIGKACYVWKTDTIYEHCTIYSAS